MSRGSFPLFPLLGAKVQVRTQVGTARGSHSVPTRSRTPAGHRGQPSPGGGEPFLSYPPPGIRQPVPRAVRRLPAVPRARQQIRTVHRLWSPEGRAALPLRFVCRLNPRAPALGGPGSPETRAVRLVMYRTVMAIARRADRHGHRAGGGPFAHPYWFACRRGAARLCAARSDVRVSAASVMTLAGKPTVMTIGAGDVFQLKHPRVERLCVRHRASAVSSVCHDLPKCHDPRVARLRCRTGRAPGRGEGCSMFTSLMCSRGGAPARV